MAPVRVAVLLLLALAAGCASYASRATARPAPVGHTTVAIAADAVVFEHGREYFVAPSPELSVRRGMSERWDLGGRFGFGSAEVAATVRLRDGENWALAAVPNAGLGFVPVTNNGTDLLRLHAGARLVLERDLSDGVAVAASAGGRFALTGPGTIFGGEAGELRVLTEPSVSLGLRIKAGSRVVWPEVGMVLPVDFGTGAEKPAVQAGVALEF